MSCSLAAFLNHSHRVYSCLHSVLITPLEPVGGSVPKFPNVDKIRGFETKLSACYTLLCPAQGFPLPTYK